MEKKEKLEKLIGYGFRNRNLLDSALSHPSYDREDCYERLEFLGDLILDAIVGVNLFKKRKDVDEAFLTDLKSAYVNSRNLHEVGVSLNLGSFVKHRNSELPKLDNFVEALIGAIYLDGGWRNSERFVKKFILSRELRPIDNYKNLLVMAAAKFFKSQPVYTLVKEKGPPHRRIYTFKVKISGKKYVGTGTGRNKKQAEAKAAEMLIAKLEKYCPEIKSLRNGN